MKAITLIRPWSWAVSDAGKGVENRTWSPPASLLKPGDPLLVHAGRKYEETAAAFILKACGKRPPLELACPMGIVAIAVFAGVVDDPLEDLPALQVPWFVGPLGWVLRDVVALRPYPIRGQQGLWDVPQSVVEQLEPVDEDRAERFHAAYLAAGIASRGPTKNVLDELYDRGRR